MRSIFRSTIILLLMTFLFSGCNLGAQAPQLPTADVAAASTQAFETISVTQTLGALGQLQFQPTETIVPPTVLPSLTEEPSSTMLPPITLATETPLVPDELSTDTPEPTLAPGDSYAACYRKYQLPGRSEPNVWRGRLCNHRYGAPGTWNKCRSFLVVGG